VHLLNPIHAGYGSVNARFACVSADIYGGPALGVRGMKNAYILLLYMKPRYGGDAAGFPWQTVRLKR
jgi:hypothetical protein